MTIICVDADALVTEPVSHPQRADRDRWLGGAVPGPIPDRGLHPVLSDRGRV
ncbi:MAG: hypothetical protein H7Y15_04865 [Pseudonocardia sp.]|nr:hypothetical protein [Pseudonocardia sp.]